MRHGPSPPSPLSSLSLRRSQCLLTSFTTDNDEVLEAVKEDGSLLRFATEETRETNKEICLAAVSVTGTAIQYCGRDLKTDVEICSAAVGQDWRALRHVGRVMQREESVVLLAIAKGGDAALSLADRAMSRNYSVILALLEQDGKNLKVRVAVSLLSP